MFKIIGDWELDENGKREYVYSLARENEKFEGLYVERIDREGGEEDEDDEEGEAFYELNSYSWEVTDKLLQYSIFEFPDNSYIKWLWKTVDNYSFFLFLDMPPLMPFLFPELEETIYNFKFLIKVDLLSWAKKYTILDYIDGFESIFKLKNSDAFLHGRIEHGEDQADLNVLIRQSFSYESIIKNISETLGFLEQVHYETVKKLEDSSNKNSLTFSFKFPEELRISCEQYLLYFGKFLQDLGIKATSNIEEEIGNILFSITPTDNITALDKIREALAVYLNLPSSPIVYDESIAAIRLQQQIESLRHSQKLAVREIQLAEKVIELQADTLQEKNIIISQKDLTIDQQARILEKISSQSIMVDSLENKEELEEIFDGLKIGKSKFLAEQLGIHLNPATVIKTAVNKFTGKENDKTSVLGLEEENKDIEQ
ncbi:MAG TPA: hypothetical protein VGO50_15325 [Pyrinomonadaceae bacterium]|jgi:hypothetical protein|nr:hypothetical protein [Pyrinomonadaceae bacterium]